MKEERKIMSICRKRNRISSIYRKRNRISIYPPAEELKKLPLFKKCTQEEFNKKYEELQNAKTPEEILELQKELVPMRRYLYGI